MLRTADGLPRADHDCCLWMIGSIKTPQCIVTKQKEMIMGRRKGADTIDSEPGDCAGRSILEMIEDELDKTFEWLKGNLEGQDERAIENAKGKAQGYAESLAIIRNPYYPNVNAVKAEAVERWEWHHRLDETSEES